MSLLKIFDVAASAMNAQSQRLNVVASNLANADSATSASGQPYRAKQVVFTTAAVGAGAASAGSSAPAAAEGVAVSAVIEDPSPMKQVFEPKHPLADDKGYVTMPNVNVVDEMVNMISASRSYQNNVEVLNTAKSLLMRTLQLGQ